jgi:hypothetical protein
VLLEIEINHIILHPSYQFSLVPVYNDEMTPAYKEIDFIIWHAKCVRRLVGVIMAVNQAGRGSFDSVFQSKPAVVFLGSRLFQSARERTFQQS